MKPSAALLACPPPTWAPLLLASQADLLEADRMLAQSEVLYGKTTPSEDHVFLPLYLCPLDQVRVVWVTAEPLPGLSYRDPSKPLSQGMGPGTERSDRPAPGLRALLADEGRTATHGDLRAWAYQGVLFLSLALTAPLQRGGRVPSHAAFWSGFVKRLCEHVQQHRPDAVFVAFGKGGVAVRQYLSGRAVVVEAPDLWDRAYPGTKVFAKINAALPKGSPPLSFAF
jgi:uracil DNA glycosylase